MVIVYFLALLLDQAGRGFLDASFIGRTRGMSFCHRVGAGKGTEVKATRGKFYHDNVAWCGVGVGSVCLHLGLLRSRTIERGRNKKCSLFLRIINIDWSRHPQFP